MVLMIAAGVSISVLTVLVYFSLKIDWARMIGKWFPWAMENSDKDKL